MNTTTYRNTPAGIIAIRGKRELHMLGTSVEATERSRALLASSSFDALFKSARRSPAGRNVRFIKVEG